jgi:hypothetical protein
MMCQKDTTFENIERAQGTEKLTANGNDGKHIGKSRKSQKGGNEHKKSKNFECNAESKATEQLKLTTETAEQEQRRSKRKDQNRKKARNSSLECVCGSAPENHSKNRKSSIARRTEVTSTKFIHFAGSVRKSFAFLCSRPFDFRPFCSVFLLFCSAFAFLRFSLFSSFLLFLIVQTNDNNASPS